MENTVFVFGKKGQNQWFSTVKFIELVSEKSENRCIAFLNEKMGFPSVKSSSATKSCYKPKTSYICAVKNDLIPVESRLNRSRNEQNPKKNWLVYQKSTNDTYIIHDDMFQQLYEPVRDGLYLKKPSVVVSAWQAEEDEPGGKYQRGDYIVTYSSGEQSEIRKDKFEKLYAIVNSDESECETETDSFEESLYSSAHAMRTGSDVNRIKEDMADAKRDADFYQRFSYCLTFIMIIASVMITIILCQGDTEKNKYRTSIAASIVSTSATVRSITDVKATRKLSLRNQLAKEISNFEAKEFFGIQ